MEIERRICLVEVVSFMWAYVLSFLGSTLCVYSAEKINSKEVQRILLLLAILITSLLAAFRALSIGTDVLNYVQPMFINAQKANNFSEYLNSPILSDWSLVPVSSFEYGYTIIVFICAKLFGNIFSLLFITQFVIIGCVLIGLWRQRKELLVSLGIFSYYFLFYNTSLNMVRQSIAMAILFMAFSYLRNRKIITYFILMIIATLFHRTAIIGIIIFLLYMSFYRNSRTVRLGNNLSLNTKTIKLIFIGIISFTIVFIPSIFQIVLKLLGISQYAEGYITNTIHFSLNGSLVCLAIILIVILCWDAVNNDKLKYLYMGLLICDLATVQLTTASTYASRISLYFMMFYVYIVPTFLCRITDRKRKLALVIYILLLCLYWYYTIVYLKYNDTIPYVIAPNFNF